MHRKPLRKTFNFNLQKKASSQQNIEENPPIQDSPTSPSQETLPLPRPTRVAKVRCTENLTEIINKERSYNLNTRRERSRLRASKRVANESIEQREQRLEDMRRRASQRMATESVKQREQRLEYMRQRMSQRVASESVEQREQRLEDLRRRASQRVATESSEQREHRLEKQRRRDTRRRAALEMNYLPTYTCAISANEPYHTLGPFEVLCNHCGSINDILTINNNKK